MLSFELAVCQCWTMPSFRDGSPVHCFGSHQMSSRDDDEEETGGAVPCGTDDSDGTVEKRISLCDIGDDSLSTVLSFLSPQDIVKCSAVCRYLKAFCKDDKKIWLPMCERRWGTKTSVQNWGRRNVAFKVLYSVLTTLENLVGFWRGVDHGASGSLVVFEWGSHYVSGFRVSPSRPSSYAVCKVPFVWIGVSEMGRPVCFFDPDQSATRFRCTSGTSTCTPSSSSRGPPPMKENSSKSGRKNPFVELGPELDLEQQSPPSGLVIVDLHFVGKFHIVMEELQQPQFVGNRSLAEAAVVASFGSCGNLAAAAAAASAGSSPSPDSDKYGYGQSPPGSFQYEMFQFIASKVTSQGGERASRRQRRRERERAFIQGRRTCEPEHFVKVREIGPTKERPLQGLWKGICDSEGLDFLMLLYDDQGGIVCRRVGECLGTAHSGSVFWTAKSGRTIMAPLPAFEEDMYNVRQRIWPKFYPDMGGQQEVTRRIHDELDEEVVGMLCTNRILGLDFGQNPERDNEVEGRVWQYASGRFGFGFLPNNFIIDFRPICSPSGVLLDVLD
ncbi:unnamed protein product [Calypogeia fissa]